LPFDLVTQPISVFCRDLQVERYDHIIVLADSNLTVQEADARTLLTLLHLTDISEKNGKRFSVVSENARPA